MAIDDKDCVEVVIRNEPILKRIELKNIGYLQKQPVFVNCPACEAEALSTVRQEVVTCWQHIVTITKVCKKWLNAHDVNHYCSKCGCYIGRYSPIGCVERCLSKRARTLAANDSLILKKPVKICAEKVQESKERYRARRAGQKAAEEEDPVKKERK